MFYVRCWQSPNYFFQFNLFLPLTRILALHTASAKLRSTAYTTIAYICYFVCFSISTSNYVFNFNKISRIRSRTRFYLLTQTWVLPELWILAYCYEWVLPRLFKTQDRSSTSISFTIKLMHIIWLGLIKIILWIIIVIECMECNVNMNEYF